MVDTTLAQARRMGAPRAIALCQCFDGALKYQAGLWDEAAAVLNESIQLYRELGAASGEASALMRLGILQTARGELEAAMSSLTKGMVVAERAAMRAHCQSRLCSAITHNRLMVGDLPAAERMLALGFEMSKRHSHCASCDAMLLPVAVSVYIALGKLQQAEVFCRQLEHTADQYASRVWIAMARRSRGEILATHSRWEEALASYEEAHQAYQAAGYDYEAARCLLDMADLHATHCPHDEQHVAAIRRQAQAVFEQLGAA